MVVRKKINYVSDNEDDCTLFVDDGANETGDDSENCNETKDDNCDDDTVDISDR